MIKVVESGQSLGARIENLDLSRPLDDAQFRQVEQLLGRHGVLSFPGRT